MTVENNIEQLSTRELADIDMGQLIYGSAMPLRKSQMPGEKVTELHPDDAKALEERAETKRKRLIIFALAHKYGTPAFQEIEPPGGYDTTGQPGDILEEGVVIEIELELERTA